MREYFSLGNALFKFLLFEIVSGTKGNADFVTLRVHKQRHTFNHGLICFIDASPQEHRNEPVSKKIKHQFLSRCAVKPTRRKGERSQRMNGHKKYRDQ